MRIFSWDKVDEEEVKEPDWLIDPFAVKGGITFLWGKTSTGKSPVTWEMAGSVGDGRPFFGLPTRQGKVLYVDVDSPESVAITRLQSHRRRPANVTYVATKPLQLGYSGAPDEQTEQLKGFCKQYTPDLVILNTLRKIHDMDDKDSRTPKIVYAYFQYLFPHSGIVVVHHAKKDLLDPKARKIPSESFSGSQAWVNDAQVALRLDRFKRISKRKKILRQNLSLAHAKSQVSRRLKPIPLVLEPDGTNMSCSSMDDREKVIEGLGKGLTGSRLDQYIAEERDISEEWARHARLSVENGLYPGSREWVGYQDDEEDEGDEV